MHVKVLNGSRREISPLCVIDTCNPTDGCSEDCYVYDGCGGDDPCSANDNPCTIWDGCSSSD